MIQIVPVWCSVAEHPRPCGSRESPPSKPLSRAVGRIAVHVATIDETGRILKIAYVLMHWMFAITFGGLLKTLLVRLKIWAPIRLCTQFTTSGSAANALRTGSSSRAKQFVHAMQGRFRLDNAFDDHHVAHDFHRATAGLGAINNVQKTLIQPVQRRGVDQVRVTTRTHRDDIVEFDLIQRHTTLLTLSYPLICLAWQFDASWWAQKQEKQAKKSRDIVAAFRHLSVLLG